VQSVTRLVAGYIDQTSEEIVTAYSQERENWLRNRSTVQAAWIRDLLSGARVEVSAAEAILGYRLRQYHVGVVCWTDGAADAGDARFALQNDFRGQLIQVLAALIVIAGAVATWQ
jgi:hypothetical protein